MPSDAIVCHFHTPRCRKKRNTGEGDGSFKDGILTSVRSCIRNFWCSREPGRSRTNIRIPAGKCRPTPTGINSECVPRFLKTRKLLCACTWKEPASGADYALNTCEYAPFGHAARQRRFKIFRALSGVPSPSDNILITVSLTSFRIEFSLIKMLKHR